MPRIRAPLVFRSWFPGTGRWNAAGMADPERDEPSLELPSLGGGWRRRRRDRAAKASAKPTGEVAGTVAAAPSGEQATVPVVQTVAEAPPARERRARPDIRLPGGWPAVLATGVVVGLVVVGLTWLSLRTCEAVQGTTSCGTAGYPMLGLVLVLAVLAGSTLLRLAQVPDPVSTSLLAVGCAAVIALVFLIDHLDQPAMVIVIPLVCAATFAGAHWLTTAVIEPRER